MPLVAHSDLPTFAELRRREMLSLDRAIHQDIRELHIGFLNMMPDAALQATERQFIRLVGSCNRIAQFFVYPFSLPELGRSAETQAYIERYYSDFGELRKQGLDALIVTGANVANPALDQERFWDPLVDIVRWGRENVTSILCSCLATHALLKLFHGVERRPMPRKKWGVYSHRITAPNHPLLREINTRFDAPHSRYNDISREQFERAGLTVLAESEEGGVHVAASADQFRIIYFQGHPEYDYNSLLKEYKREVLRYFNDELSEPPPFPEHYFDDEAGAIANAYVERAARCRAAGDPIPPFDDTESAIETRIDNTWGDTGKAIVNNWLGLVYQTTNLDRTKQFMSGIDPDDPLGIHARNKR